MAFFVWKNVQQVDQLPSSPDYFLLAGSMLLNWCGFLSVIAVWMFLLGSYGERLSPGHAYRIYFRSNLGKYLPGKVWQLAGMVFLCSEIGIPARKSLAASLYNTGIAVLTGLAIFLITIPVSMTGPVVGRHWQYVFAAVMLLFVLYPDILTKVLNFGLRALGREKITEGIGRKTLILSILFYSLSWSIFGWSFHTFLAFLGSSGGPGIIETTGILAGSVTIGFLAFFSPGGIGVREGVMVFFLKGYFPLKTAVFISVCARLWITSVEVLGLCTTYLVPSTSGSKKGNCAKENEKGEKVQKTG